MTLHIEKPTAVLNVATAKRNIARMAEKARKSGVRFRPHFKTHQSAVVGAWFRDEGVEAITASSVSTARYFADHGWTDITVAFPVNCLEIDATNTLAARVQLNLLVESPETVRFLQEKLARPVRVWLKIDAGCNRTGIKWDDVESLRTIAKTIQTADKLTLQGSLAHSGNSYSADSQAGIHAIYRETVERLKAVRDTLSGTGLPDFEISIGDTPCWNLGCKLSARTEERRTGYARKTCRRYGHVFSRLSKKGVDCHRGIKREGGWDRPHGGLGGLQDRRQPGWRYVDFLHEHFVRSLFRVYLDFTVRKPPIAWSMSAFRYRPLVTCTRSPAAAGWFAQSGNRA